jgi:hypothetical protein
VSAKRARTKKGPKRVKKKAATAEDLDQEMEDYRAAVPGAPDTATQAPITVS